MAAWPFSAQAQAKPATAIAPAKAEAAPAAEVPEELLIAPSQDLEMMRQAWTTAVKVNYHNQTIHDILADLAKQSGIDIRVELPPLRDGSDGNGGGINTAYLTAFAERAEFFLGKEAAAKLASARYKYRYGRGLVQEYRAPKRLPLAIAVEALVRDVARAEVSYRQSFIEVAGAASLRHELLVTRKFKFQQGGWGSIYRVNYNGKDLAFRLTMVDAVAHEMLRWSIPLTEEERLSFDFETGPNPAGAAARLKSIDPKLEVSFDEASQVLTITAPPSAIDRFARWQFKELDVPSPDEQVAEAERFGLARLKELAPPAFRQLPKEQQKKLTLAAKAWLAEEPPGVADEQVIAGAGVAAAVPILELDLKQASATAKARIGKLLHDLYADREITLIRERVEDYLKAGTAGEFEKVCRDFWNQKRREEFAKEKREFAERLVAAKADAEVKKQLVEEYGLPVDVDLGQVPEHYYDQYYAKLMRADRIRLERIRLAGKWALATVSFEVPKDHPEAKFAAELSEDVGPRLACDISLEFEDGRWLASSGAGKFVGEDGAARSVTTVTVGNDGSMVSRPTSGELQEAGNWPTIVWTPKLKDETATAPDSTVTVQVTETTEHADGSISHGIAAGAMAYIFPLGY